MTTVRRLVLDVLKPHEPSLLAFSQRIAEVDDVDAARGTLIELDREVQNVEVTVEGPDLDFAAVEDAIEGLGGTVHSVDEVACGAYVVTDGSAGDGAGTAERGDDEARGG